MSRPGTAGSSGTLDGARFHLPGQRFKTYFSFVTLFIFDF